MKNISLSLLLALSAAACGDDNITQIECGANTTLVDGECVGNGSGSGSNITCGAGTMNENGTCVPTVTPKTYVQVEHLARPGINEALLLSDGFLTGYNATAPTFAGVPPAVLDQVVGEAKTVLKAIYLGVCFLNGAANVPGPLQFRPGGIQCHAVGGAILEGDGETQTAASIAAAGAYADAVFGLFIPDVMRVDTGITSAYLTPCSGGPVGLCGGRFVRDDVIDVTYDFLFNGARTCSLGAFCGGPPNQITAIVSDGVAFAPGDAGGDGSKSRHQGDPNNKNQGHPEVSNSFPYSAKPF